MSAISCISFSVYTRLIVVDYSYFWSHFVTILIIFIHHHMVSNSDNSNIIIITIILILILMHKK